LGEEKKGEFEQTARRVKAYKSYIKQQEEKKRKGTSFGDKLNKLKSSKSLKGMFGKRGSGPEGMATNVVTPFESEKKELGSELEESIDQLELQNSLP